MAWADVLVNIKGVVDKRDIERQLNDVDAGKAGKTAGDKYSAALTRSLASAKPTAVAGLDTTPAEKSRAALLAKLADLSKRAVTARARLDVDDKDGLAKVTGFQVRLAALSKTVTGLKLDVDTSGMARAEAQMAALDAAMHKTAATSNETRGGLSGLVAEITGLGGANAGTARQAELFGRVLTGVNLATGLLEPAIAGLVVTAGAATAMFAAGGLGIAAFGAATAGAIKDATNATGRLSDAQMQIVTSIGQAKAAWQGFISTATPSVARTLADAVSLLPRGFQLLQQFIPPAETALRGVIGQIRAAIAPGTQFSDVMGKLATASGPILRNTLGAVVNVIEGLAGVIRAFLPEGERLSSWVQDATARFREWGLTLSQHTGFQSLMAMFREETPLAMAILRNLGQVILNITAAMAGLATSANSKLLLQALMPISAILRELSGNRVLMDIALYMLAIHSAASKLGPVITAVASGFQALTSGTLAVKMAGLQQSAAGLASTVVKLAASPWTWLAAAAIGAAALYLWISRNKDATVQWLDTLKQNIATQSTVTGVQQATAMAISQVTAKIIENDNWLRQNYQGWSNLDTGVGQASEAVKEHLYRQQELAAGMQQLSGIQTLVSGRLSTLAGQYGGMSRVMALLNTAQVTSEEITSKNADTWQRATVRIASAAAAQDSLRLGTDRLTASNNALGNSWLTTTVPALQKMTQAEDNLMAVLLSGEQSFISYQQAINATAQDTQKAAASGAQLASAQAAVATAQNRLNELQTSGHATALQLSAAHDQLSAAQARLNTLQQTATYTVGGLDAGSLKLSSDYYGTVIPGLQKMSSSMVNMGATTAQLTTVLATGAGQALKFAGSNDTARAMVVALINNALGPGTVSLQNLNTWVRNNSTSLTGMNTIVGTVTTSASVLAGVLRDQLNQMLAQSAARALGGQQAFNTFAQQLLTSNTDANTLVANGGQRVLAMLLQMSGNSVPAARNAFNAWAQSLGLSRQRSDELWAALVRQRLTDAANKAGTSKSAFDALASSLGVSRQRSDELWNSLHRLPAQTNLRLTMQGTGTYQITQGTSGMGGTPTGQGRYAAGGYITAGTGPTADNVPIWASRGEYVIKAASVARYGPRMMDAINAGRYAAGGPVGNLTGPYITGMYDDFKTKMTNAMVAAMRAAIKAAINAAVRAAAAAGAAVPGGPAPSGPLQDYAKKLLAQYGWAGQWAAFNNLVMGESGWRVTATNPTSGAYGIPQALPASKMASAGADWRTSGYTQLRWMMSYIRCFTIDTVILTRDGWKTYDQVKPGDETIGYNPATGHNEWTTITDISVYDDAPLIRMACKTWEATCTPHHRWVVSRLRQVETRRHVDGHRVPGPPSTSYRTDEIIPANELRQRDQIRLAALAATGDGPAISTGEAELLGWVMGDGSVSGYGVRCDPQGALAEKILRAAAENPQASYRAIARAAGCTHQTVGAYLRANGHTGGGAHNRTGTGSMRRITLGQAKSAGIKAIDALLASEGILFSRHEYAAKGISMLPRVAWNLHASYSGELLKRSGYDHADPVPFVLSLSPAQREAFLRGVFGAEGWTEPDTMFNGYAMRGGRSCSQADGPQQDAIVLAIYLSGRRPAVRNWGPGQGGALRKRDGANIGDTKPFVTAQYVKTENAGTAKVWCPTTTLGSWTARQGRQVFLTGNSVYGSPANAYAKWLSRSPHWYRHGGPIDEPVTGVGRYSSTLYHFGEAGREWVIPDAAFQRRGSDGASTAEVIRLLRLLIDTTAAVPARTGQHVTTGLNTTAAASAYRARYPAGGI